MGWPVPEIPEKPVIPAPRFGLWCIVLAVMIISGSLLALFIGRFSTYTPVLFYGALPAFCYGFAFLALHLTATISLVRLYISGMKKARKRNGSGSSGVGNNSRLWAMFY